MVGESEAASVPIDHENENQFLLLFRNLIVIGLDYVASYTVLAIHYLLLPAIFLHSFWNHASDRIWMITKTLFLDIKELLKIVPLSIKIVFWSNVIFLRYISFFKSAEDTKVEVIQKIYERAKEILKIVNGLPLNTKHATALYSILMKIPIFGKALPFPEFLFEQTFKKISFRKGMVNLVLTPVESDSVKKWEISQPLPETSEQAETEKSQPKSEPEPIKKESQSTSQKDSSPSTTSPSSTSSTTKTTSSSTTASSPSTTSSSSTTTSKTTTTSSTTASSPSTTL